MQKSKTFVELCIINPGERASTITLRREGWFVADRQDFVFQSRLDLGAKPSEHLKWLHMILEHERKWLRQLQEAGVEMVCRIRVRARELAIEPEALLLMHQLHLRTEIEFRP